MLLDTATHFQCNLNNFFQFFFGKLTIWVHQLQITVYHTTNRNCITLIQISPQTEVVIKCISILLLAKLSDELCQIVTDKTIIISKMLRSELRYLPSWKITVHTIKKCCICSHFLRERCKQTGCFQQHVYTLIDISHKYHGRSSSFFFFATGKRAGCHVILHNLNAIFIFKLDTSHFIKGYTVP